MGGLEKREFNLNSSTFPCPISALNDLLFGYVKSKRGTGAQSKRSGSIAILQSDTYIARTITKNKWLIVDRTFGKETPTPVNYDLIREENDLYVLAAEQVGHCTKGYIGYEVPKCINIQDLCIYT